MAELAPKERLQPSLLDRLTDDEPDQRRESLERRVLSVQKLSECVRRDLGFLLNSTQLSALQDLSDFPEVERSGVNYGIPDLAGRPASTIDSMAMARRIKRAILDFEPRLIARSLKVEVVVDSDSHSPNALHFDIQADMWCQPVPLRLYLRTDLNLEDGEALVREADAR